MTKSRGRFNSDPDDFEIIKKQPEQPADKPTDWRKTIDEEYDVDPDDEELPQTPPDVVQELGFDPKEFSEGE